MEDAGLLPEHELVAQVLCSGADNCTIHEIAPGPEAHAVRLSCLTEEPPAPLLRLVGGNEHSGLLELRPPLGDWGRVCAATFDAAQAKVGGATGRRHEAPCCCRVDRYGGGGLETCAFSHSLSQAVNGPQFLFLGTCVYVFLSFDFACKTKWSLSVGE